MLYKANDPGMNKMELVDCAGKVIPGVTEYDDETQEATLILLTRANQAIVVPNPDPSYVIDHEILKIKAKIPGSKLQQKT